MSISNKWVKVTATTPKVDYQQVTHSLGWAPSFILVKQTQQSVEYNMRSNKGKYSIYKWEYNSMGERTSTTLAKGVDKETATGMMKLLKEPK